MVNRLLVENLSKDNILIFTTLLGEKKDLRVFIEDKIKNYQKKKYGGKDAIGGKGYMKKKTNKRTRIALKFLKKKYDGKN